MEHGVIQAGGQFFALGESVRTCKIMVVHNHELTNPCCLALETSGAWGSAALGRGPVILAVRTLDQPRQYAAEFLPTIQKLCAEHKTAPSDVRLVFISSGPGSFTGLRIGVTAARMISLSSGALLVAVPTLDVIAQNALDAEPAVDHVAVVLDAKRGNVYAAWYRRNGAVLEAQSAASEVEPFAFLSELPADCAVLGEGVTYHRAAIERASRLILPEPLWPPRAETVYRLGYVKALAGQFVNRRDLIPIYVRPPEAEEKFVPRPNP